ncbi:phage tail protein, partial [Achromobacter xylosoxidans]|uniref:phage tail protein n=1 Tax=Alcaligenes xylosoxydans xylosoxydans TaxID=85698 RepID=UPI003F688A5E
IMGSSGSLQLLRRMGNTGKAYVMVDGLGTVHGAFIIERLEEEALVFDRGHCVVPLAYAVQKREVRFVGLVDVLHLRIAEGAD